MKGVFLAVAVLLPFSPAAATTVFVVSGSYDQAVGLPVTVADLSSSGLVPGLYNYRLSADRGARVHIDVQTRAHSSTYCGGTLCGESETIFHNRGSERTFNSFFGKFALARGRKDGHAPDYVIHDPETTYQAIFSFEPYKPKAGTGSYGLVLYRVPEPATWTMMILGFGSIGICQRLRLRSIARVQAG